MPDHLKFGLTSINTGATSYPEALVNLAQAAETPDLTRCGQANTCARQIPQRACHRPSAY